MSKFAYPIALLYFSFFTLPVSAENKFYLQFNAGGAFASSYFQERGSICSPLAQCFKDTYKERYDPGYAASVAIGYRIAENFRVELEGLYQSNDNDQFERTYFNPFQGSGSFTGKLDGERERTAFLLNGYYDFVNSSDFTPFISAGLGGYHMRLNSTFDSVENDLDFAWQAGAGINYRLNDQISFDLKYRYFGGANAELAQQYGNWTYKQFRDVGEHQIMAGIRIGF
jgi:opacity protein-like surface antigen